MPSCPSAEQPAPLLSAGSREPGSFPTSAPTPLRGSFPLPEPGFYRAADLVRFANLQFHAAFVAMAT